MPGLVVTWVLAWVSLAGSQPGPELTLSTAETLCRQNVTARAGMTARMFCCLGVRNRGAEVRIENTAGGS